MTTGKSQIAGEMPGQTRPSVVYRSTLMGGLKTASTFNPVYVKDRR